MSRKIRCPIARTLDIVGDRWTLLIVRDLLRGRKRFSDLRQSVEGIPGSVLSDRLRLLEREGILLRRNYSEHPPRAEYVLTQKGHDLGLVVGALSSWGERHVEHDRSLVDNQCGHGVSVVYHCETCGRKAPRSRVRFVEALEGTGHSHLGSGELNAVDPQQHADSH